MASQAVCIPLAEKGPGPPRCAFIRRWSSSTGPHRGRGLPDAPRLLEGFGALYHKAFLERQLMLARPLTASIVLLAHRMGVADGGSVIDAANSRDPAALHALFGGFQLSHGHDGGSLPKLQIVP